MKSSAFRKKDFYFISDLASILHVSTHTIRNLENEFNIEVKKDLNGKRVYTLEDIEKYRLILERKNESKDVSTLKKSSSLILNPDKATNLLPNDESFVYSSITQPQSGELEYSESFFNVIKNALSSKAISYYSLALFTVVTGFSFGSFYLDKYLDLDTNNSFIDSSKYMSNVLQSTDTTWDYRFDVNVPAYFNNTMTASSASFDLIRVGDRVIITPQGISAPNIVNTISTIAGDEVLLVDITNPNNPIISVSENPTFNEVTIGTLNGVTTLDDTTIQTIQDNIAAGAGDATTLNGFTDTDFLRSNTDTVFTNGIMTFDASSSLKFNNLSANSFLRLDSAKNLSYYTIEPGLNVTFTSTANSMTINVDTGASSNVFASAAISSLFIGGSSFDMSNYVQASASEINKLLGLTGDILTTNNFISNFSNVDTNASDDLLTSNLSSSIFSIFPNIDTNAANDIISSNLASSIITAFPDIDTTGSNKVLISSLASLMLTNYANLDTNATDDLLTSNLSSSLFSLFPNIDTNASDDAGVLADAVLINSDAGKNVYSTNTWFGTQTFNFAVASNFEISANGKITLNPGAIPGTTNNSIYNHSDRIYFEELPLVQMQDTHIANHVGKLSYFVTDASSRLLLTGTDNVALSFIQTGSASQILGMNGSNLSYLTVNGDLSVSTTSSSTITFNFNNVNSNAGTFGDSSYVPQITVNSKGLITSISTVALSVTATNPNNYVYDINFSSPSSSNKTLLLSRFGLSTLSASFTITSGDVVTALGYTPFNSAAFNTANITNALGYVPFGFANFVAGSNVTLSSTATSLTINSSYVDTDTNNYTSSIAFTDSNAVSKVLTLNRNGLSALTAVFSISAANVTSALGYTPEPALGYTPLNSTAFNAANITNALGFIPLQVSSIIAGSNITIDTTATTITINGVVGGTNANNYVNSISFSSPEAASRTLVLTRVGLSNLTATFSLSASDITTALGYTPLQASSTGADKYINTFGIATSLIDENVQLNFSLGRSDATTILASTTLTPAIITTALGYIPQVNLGYVPFDSSAFTSTNIISALGYTPLNSTAFNSANITNALGYVPFGFANFVAGSNVTLSSTATSLTINSSYVDTDTNNYTSSIAFTDSNAVSKVLTLNRNGLSALTAVFSISAANVTSALGFVPQVNLGYTPLRNTSDTLSGNLSITGTLSANSIFQNGYGVCDSSGNCAGLGGTILGSGNSGFLSYFTASNSIANSSIFESSAKIGILTTNPQEALDIYGAIKLSANMGTLPRTDALYNDGGTLYWNGQVVGVTGSTGPGGINGTEGYLPFFNTSNSLIATEFYYNSGNTERSLELITSLTIPTYLAIGHKGQYSAKLGVAADSSLFFTRYDSEDDVILQNTSTLSTSDMIFALNNDLGKYIFGFGTGTQAGAVVINYQNSSNSAYLGINNTNPSFALDVAGSARITGTLAIATFSNPINGTFNFLANANFRGNLSAANATLNNLSLANALPVIFGGTGLSALPTNGQLLIGNGTGYTLATLTAGSNVSISTTAGGITINSSYVDTTNANNYVNAISFSTPATGSRTLVLSREGLSDLTAVFSLSSSDITSALGYTPLQASDTAADSFVNTFGIDTNFVNQNVQFNFSLGRNDSTTILATTYITPEVVTTALGYTPFDSAAFTAANITSAIGYVPFNSASFTALNITGALGYVPFNSAAFTAANITGALGYIPFGVTNFVAGTNVSLSSTATSLTINSSDTDTNYYPTSIAFTDSASAQKTLTLNRNGQSALTAIFSLSSSDITTALGYTPFNSTAFTAANITTALGYIPLKNTTDFLTGNLGVSGDFSASNGSFNSIAVATLFNPNGSEIYVGDSLNMGDNTVLNAGYVYINGSATVGLGLSANSLTLTNALEVIYGGTGLSAAPSNGQLLIGNGTGYTLSTLVAGTGVAITNASGSITITNTVVDTDTNYYPTSIAFTDSASAQKTLTLNRNGQSALTAIFSLSASDINTALGYTPLKNTTDTLTGDLTVTGSLSIEHLYLGDYQNTSRLQLEADVTTDRKLRFEIGAANLSNATFGLNIQSVYFTTPSNATVKNLTFNQMSATDSITVDIFKAGTLPAIYNNTLDVYGATIAATYFSNPAAGSFVFFAGANFAGNLSAANGVFNNLGVVSSFSAASGSFSGNLSAGSAFINGNVSAALGFFTTTATSTFSNPLGGVFTFLTGANFNGNISAANGTFVTLSAQSLNVNNLFTVDSTGSVFNNAATFNDTAEFNAIGDVAVANDLLLTNTSYSKIKSSNDLSIEVGEPFNSSNFNLTTFNNGVINLTSNLVNVSGTLSTNTLWVGNGASVFTSDDFLTIKNFNGVNFIGQNASTYTFYEGGTTKIFTLNGENNSLAGNLFLSGNLSAAAGTFTTGNFTGNVTMASAIITGDVTIAGNLISQSFIQSASYISAADSVFTNNAFAWGNDAGQNTQIRRPAENQIDFILNGVQEVLFTATQTTLNNNLFVSGTGRITTSTAITDNAYVCTNTTTGQLEFKTATCTVSSQRFKENITSLPYSIADIMELRPVIYNYKDWDDSNPEGRTKERIGFIAEEVNEVVPEVVYKENGVIESLDYSNLISLLTKGIQEQQVQILALSEAQASVNFSQAASMYDAFMNTIDNLSMSTENGSLVVNTNLTVTGRSLFNDASFTGDVTIGQMKFDSLNNDLSFNGTSCVNIDGTLNTSLCDSQTMYLMKNKAGNLNIFDGKVVINPLGEMTVEKIQAGEVAAAKVKASEYEIVAGSEVSGNTNMLAGQTEITILTSKVKSNSKIFVTANNNLEGKSLYVSDKVEGVSFKVRLSQTLSSDVNFDWFILNIE